MQSCARLLNELVDWFNAVMKSDLVKWMFAFWAPTALAVVALLRK